MRKKSQTWNLVCTLAQVAFEGDFCKEEKFKGFLKGYIFKNVNFDKERGLGDINTFAHLLK